MAERKATTFYNGDALSEVAVETMRREEQKRRNSFRLEVINLNVNPDGNRRLAEALRGRGVDPRTISPPVTVMGDTVVTDHTRVGKALDRWLGG